MAIAQTRPHRSEVLRVRSERLNVHNSAAIVADGQALIDSGATEVVIDISDVAFIDSSGIGALVRLRRNLGTGGAVVLFNPQPFVGKVLELTKMTSVFEIR